MNRACSTLAAVLLPLTSLAGQESGATPFRGGQWAAQFSWSGGLGSLGVLAFTGPARAWVLDIEFAWVNREVDITDPLGSGTGDEDFLNASVRVGRRFYQARTAKVVSYQSLGVLGDLFKRTISVSPTQSFKDRGNGVGAFGELGAAYTITENLSIGLTATAQAAYATSKSEEDPSGRSRKSSGFTVSAPTMMFVATIYF
jgi:hypothetical protein